MYITIAQLKNYLDFDCTTNELSEKLTGIGLEVESIENEQIEISVPPNRGDCLCLLGIARELAVVFDTQARLPKITKFAVNSTASTTVSVIADDLCPRYLAQEIININNKIATPDWIKQALNTAGINSISLVVDVTNFVMYELGQPLHAFDLEKVCSQINVRRASQHEKIELLDGKALELAEGCLVIADETKPLAIAGVMGGKDSAVNEASTRILIECAYFDPISIRKTAKKCKITTESSYRYERQIDPKIQQFALSRAVGLIVEIAGGEISEVVEIENNKYFHPPVPIELRLKRVQQILGVKIEIIRIKSILRSLGMQFETMTESLLVNIPSYRHDISQEIDLIEEIARFNGFNNIPTQMPTIAIRPVKPLATNRIKLKNYLTSIGFYEVINYSFVSEHQLDCFNYNVLPALLNPISADLSIMRTSLVPGLINALLHNQNRQQSVIKLFEAGCCFTTNADNIIQDDKLAGIVHGAISDEQWAQPTRKVDFFDIKNYLESFATLTNNAFVYKRSKNPALHPGQAADLYLADRKIGYLGALNPNLVNTWDLNSPVFVFELDLDSVCDFKQPQFRPYSKFPHIRRDLAIVVDEQIQVEELLNHIREVSGEILKTIVVFDVYKGKNIEQGKQSIGMGLVLQEITRTLIDTEVNDLVEKIIVELETKFAAQIRK